jgi:hypothetical protein
MNKLSSPGFASSNYHRVVGNIHSGLQRRFDEENPGDYFNETKVQSLKNYRNELYVCPVFLGNGQMFNLAVDT